VETVPLGKTDIRVSALCFGTDLIGSRIPQADAFGLFDLFREDGGTFIDTANFYAAWLEGWQGGESETAIGHWMKERGNRDDMVIATKLGFDYPGSEGGLSASEIERECEKSLTRLQTDHIDLYYAHVDDLKTPLEETMEAYDRLIRAGKVRAIGASNLKGWRIAEANLLCQLKEWTPYAAIEQRYTYLRPRHSASFGPQLWMNDDVRDYSQAHGLTLIGYSVLLQGAYTRDDRPVPAQFAGPDSEERLAALSAVAAEAGATMNQTIIAWMRQSDPPILPIIAGSQKEQVLENIAALDVNLTAAQLQRLDTSGNPDVKEAWLC
jgi:aryl-alcohol dehydrogenase-like predicted oxidoreductase